MNIQEIIKRAEENPMFHRLAVVLFSELRSGRATVAELREATFLACFMYKESQEIRKSAKLR